MKRSNNAKIKTSTKNRTNTKSKTTNTKGKKNIIKKNTKIKTASTKTQKSTQKMILVVDDEKDIRSSVKTILEKNKYKVITAENGDECLKVLATKKPDLILLDIMMPGTPVCDIIDKISAPIAFLSVVRTSEDEKGELLKKPNVKSFIQKPFDLQALTDEVKRLTG